MLLVALIVVIVLFVVLPVIGAGLWLVISTLVSGLVIGALARLVLPGKQSLSITMTALIGVGGSVVGTLVARGLHRGHVIAVLLEIAVSAGAIAVLEGGARGNRALTR